MEIKVKTKNHKDTKLIVCTLIDKSNKVIAERETLLKNVSEGESRGGKWMNWLIKDTIEDLLHLMVVDLMDNVEAVRFVSSEIKNNSLFRVPKKPRGFHLKWDDLEYAPVTNLRSSCKISCDAPNDERQMKAFVYRNLTNLCDLLLGHRYDPREWLEDFLEEIKDRKWTVGKTLKEMDSSHE